MLPKEKTPPKTNLSDLIMLIYGPSKIGKSTWCSQIEGALFLATEAGLNNLEVFQAPIATWEDFLQACKEIAEGNHPYKAVIIDTIDNAYRMCAEYICAKYKVQHESDLDYGKGYALIKNEMFRVLTKLSHLPYGLFLVGHSQEKELSTRTGKITKATLTLPERGREMIVGMVDIILFCDFEIKTNGDNERIARRVMRTKPSTHYEAGDRTGRLPEVIDLDYQKFVEAFNGKKGKKS